MGTKLPTRNIILIGGFTQTTRTYTGMVKLYQALHPVVSGSNVFLGWPQTWHIDIPATVEMLRNSGVEKTEVVIVAYSYGAEKARRLVWALDEKGIKVAHLFLIDPVRRIDWLPGATAALGWFGWIRKRTPMKIPTNVANVHHYFQRIKWPFGWPVKVHDSKATIHTSTRIGRTHADMDDSRRIHDDVLRIVEAWMRTQSTKGV